MIPNTDILIDALTAGIFGEKQTETFTFLNEITRRLDVKKNIDIL